MPTTPELLLQNGILWTGNPRDPFAEHMISAGGRVLSIGKGKSGAGEAVSSIDLERHFAMPGFVDAHTHFRIGGASLNRLDLRRARDESEFSEIVRARAATHPNGRWLLGGNWDHQNWKSRKLPSKELIDGFTSSFPVFLDRVDTHVALVNSAALRLAGITRESSDPRGGVLGRDERGEPTGILKDSAREMVLRLVPDPPPDELSRDAREAMNLANKFGVTTANDIGPLRDLKAYSELAEAGNMSVRINMVLPISDYSTLIRRGIRADVHRGVSEWIRMGAVKAFADGSLGAGTAWFYGPYEDDRSNSGLANEMLSSGELERRALDADRNHIQLAIHAIGDRAVGSVLDLYEQIERENPRWDRRSRIEHAQHVRNEDFDRFARMNIIASVQPYHCIDDGRWAETKIGRDRAGTSFAFRRFIDENISVAFGTDWPVAPLDPLQGISAAVTRATTDGMNPGGWIPEQRIGLEEALRAYTYGSAYASFMENEAGTLSIGKYSDVVVLSRNPFEVSEEELKTIRVIMTIVGGKVVYSDGTLHDSE